MENKIIVNESDLSGLIGYVHTLLDFIDVDDFEDEENVDLVNGGYDDFVEPIIKAMREQR